MAGCSAAGKQKSEKANLGNGWPEQLVGGSALYRMARCNADTIRRTVAYFNPLHDGYQQARTANIEVDVQTMLARTMVMVVVQSGVIVRMAIPTMEMSALMCVMVCLIVVSVMGMSNLVMLMSMHKKTGEYPG
jgi:hypothetical protein